MLIGFDASRAFVLEATGTENYSLKLLKALAKVDYKNTYRVYLRQVARSGRFSKLRRQFPGNFEFRLIRPSRLWTQFGLALETWRAPVDLLFVPAHTLPILGNPKVKTVVTIHDLGVEYLPGYHQFPQRYYLDFASRYAAAHSDAIIAVSAATKRDLMKRYETRPKKIFVVHEGVDRAFFNPQSKSEVGRVKKKYKITDRYILFVGTVQPRKNLPMLIRAFVKLVLRLQSTDYSQKKAVDSRQSHAVLAKSVGLRQSTVDLVFAGKLGWDYGETLALPKKLGILGRVKFLGHVPDADLPALYSGAAVFAFPSLFEGFGLPILEALACGCPVVASNIPPHRELLSKLQTANLGPQSRTGRGLHGTVYQLKTNFVPMVLVKPNDITSWANVLYQYISQYEKRSTLVTSKILDLNSFSWERVAIDTLQVFKKVLS